jgi:hypothetical protein
MLTAFAAAIIVGVCLYTLFDIVRRKAERKMLARGVLDIKEIKNDFARWPYCGKRLSLYSQAFWDGKRHVT